MSRANASIQFASSKGADRHVVSVDKEVVLAAGSVHTPQILQLSGIGNPKLLAKIGVETKVNLSAVGQNFQDHVLLTVVNSSQYPFLSVSLSEQVF